MDYETTALIGSAGKRTRQETCDRTECISGQTRWKLRSIHQEARPQRQSRVDSAPCHIDPRADRLTQKRQHQSNERNGAKATLSWRQQAQTHPCGENSSQYSHEKQSEIQSEKDQPKCKELRRPHKRTAQQISGMAGIAAHDTTQAMPGRRGLRCGAKDKGRQACHASDSLEPRVTATSTGGTRNFNGVLRKRHVALAEVIPGMAESRVAE